MACVALWLPGLHAQVAEAGLRTITSAAEVLALPEKEAAKHFPVKFTGIVTVAEPDWGGRFVVQDETGGIFVNHRGKQPAVGDRIEVQGVSSRGAFAPTLIQSSFKKVGTAPLPKPKPITIERLMGGVEDSQRVEITGLVRATGLSSTRKLQVDVSIGGHRVRVFPKLPPELNPESLIAAKVRVRGTATTSFNSSLRQLTAVNIFVPKTEDFIIEQADQNSPFEQPIVPLGDVARYRANANWAERVHIQGSLTFQRVGLDLFLQDESGGLHIESRQPLRLPIGRVVEAVGFLELINYQPVLKDAVFRQVLDGMDPKQPIKVPIEELRNGLHPSEFVVMTGRLLERTVRPVQRESGPFAGVRVLCTIQAAELTFTAECEELQEVSLLTTVPLGSTVELRGVATYETGDDGKMKTVNLLLPDAGSMKVLSKPSWFTAERMLIGFSAVCVLLAGVAGWSLTVSKKNAMLSFLVAEREKAQRELQEAHDSLEQRVKERTDQLKVEMTVRKTAELEFRAVLTERTRLARELHDTLEQALTGIALQLDTAAKLFQRNPEEVARPLELAREFLKQSQLELRHSIWNLRSRELEQFNLAEALAIGSRHIIAGSQIQLDIETTGPRKNLPEIIEENLLRIGQEAMTNVVKHSGATQVTIRLQFGAENVSLEVRDNGSGLSPERMAARGDRQFGLLGMSERAKRLGGRLDISGAVGEGTTVRAVFPLREIEEQTAAKGSPVTVL
ncbi:histidine kinase [Oleiharenicola lentus]|uniref:histidine kinase n=1 Tax=Oleiharenicola lentus TaxID=2508720 RepID=UPI003F676ED5